MNRSLAAALAVALLAGACTVSTPTATPAPTSGPRPSSPATVEIIEPAPGASVTAAKTHVRLKLVGGTIVQETTTSIRPDEGHVHLYVDNAIVSMNYGLEQDIVLTAGSHAIKAEYVAADHAPFNPRVWSAEIVVTAR
jgi:hypothetical protein